MKKINRFSTIGALFALTILFAGCQVSSDPSSSIATEPVSAVSATDQANYQAAFTLNDPTYCTKIVSEDYKKECQAALMDGQQLQAALNKVDASLCAKISNEDRQNACKVQVEVITKQNQEREALKSEIQKNDELSVTIMAGKDYTRCKELTLESAKADCEYNILTNKAIESKDPSLCDKISKEEQKGQCHEAYKKVNAPASASTLDSKTPSVK